MSLRFSPGEWEIVTESLKAATRSGLEKPKRKPRKRVLEAAVCGIVEWLESRMLLSVSISGPSTIVAGQTYTLTLSDNGTSVSYWDVNWGDGAPTNADIQQAP
jgi:hypothetical protein